MPGVDPGRLVEWVLYSRKEVMKRDQRDKDRGAFRPQADSHLAAQANY